MTTPNAGSPRWAPDPTGRFAQRWWNGERWTDFVASPRGGRAIVDPAPTSDELDSGGGSVATAGDEHEDRERSLLPQTGTTWAASAAAPPPAVDATAPHPPAAATSSPPAQWAADPFGRHAQRYWDGTRWTHAVAGAEGGAPGRDPLRPGDAGGAPPASAADPEPAVPTIGDAVAPTPRWAPDPSGRHAQRYWDGARWTPFVAEAAGGAPVHDPLDGDGPWPVPNGDGPAEPATTVGATEPAQLGDDTAAPDIATSTGAANGATRAIPSRRVWKAAAVVGAVAGVAAALALSGALSGGDGAGAKKPIRATAGPPPTRAPAHAAVGAATVTTAAASSAGLKLVDPLFDPCGLLSGPEISRSVGLTVGPAQRIPNGCAWRGTSAHAAESAQDHEALHGLEGVIARFVPAFEPRQSVLCTASVPSVPVPAGICTSPDGSQYGMYQHREAVIEIFVRTNQRVSQAQLEQLVQSAYSHTVA